MSEKKPSGFFENACKIGTPECAIFCCVAGVCLGLLLLTVGFWNALWIALGLVIIGVRRPFLSAALIAVFDIFPIVGAGMILIPWAGISLLQAKLLQAIGLVLLYVVVIVVRQFLPFIPKSICPSMFSSEKGVNGL